MSEMENLIKPRPTIDAGILKDLNLFYKYTISKLQGFPSNVCEETAALLEQKFGFKRVNGYFKCDIHTAKAGHAWNTTDDRTIIDGGTLHQFNSFLLPENQVKPGILIVSNGTPLYERFLGNRL